MKPKKIVQGITVFILLAAFVGAGGIYLNTQGASKILDNNKQTYKTDNVAIPVLMYHKIEKNENIKPYNSAKIEGNMAVTSEEFKKQLLVLKENGYKAITYGQLNNFIVNGTGIPEKPMVISFDDGYYSTYQYAYPILKELGMIAEVAVVTGVDSMDNQLGRAVESRHFDWDIAKEMEQSGIFDIQSHTVTHKNLISEDQKEIEFELAISKKSLESHLNKKITTIVYPYGTYNDEVIKNVIKAGYKIGVSTEEGLNYYKDNPMKMKRLVIVHGETGENIIERINKIASSR